LDLDLFRDQSQEWLVTLGLMILDVCLAKSRAFATYGARTKLTRTPAPIIVFLIDYGSSLLPQADLPIADT
jgi:hypothetical protein